MKKTYVISTNTMKIKNISRMMILGIVAMLLLAACGNVAENTAIQKVEGLGELGSIAVITREEGSGTRAVFAEKTGLMNTTGEKDYSDLITKQAKEVLNADEVISCVAADENAIGFVSLGALKDMTSGIKVLKVDHIAATDGTIAGDQYPLSRDLNVAFSGKKSDLENDFMNYILTAGQAIVEDGYTGVKKTDSFLSYRFDGTITIEGSTSMAPLMEQLVADYANYNPNATIQIRTSDSLSGLMDAMQEKCDWGMVSRALQDYEKEIFDYRTIAKDGVVVIVNEKNPVEDLTISQLYNIFSGDNMNWVDLNRD